MSRSGERVRAIAALAVLASVSSLALSMDLFQVRLVEQDNSRLIATSNYNYALSSPKLLAKGWQTVSVNGDQVHVTLAPSGEQRALSRASMAPGDLALIEGLRDEIANSNTGYSHITSADGFSSSSSSSGGASGGGNFMMSSTSTQGSGSSFSSSTSGGSFGNGASYNLRDDDNFSAARSDLPFNWSRVFFNGNMLTFVSRGGDVRMQPMSSLTGEQLDAVKRLKAEVLEMRRTQVQQAANTMQQSMDMVSNVFSNIMGSFPRPPDYQSSVGNMFGNNFPFGPNNSPFSAAAGWPFGGGSGAGAMAFAGRRR